MSETNNGDYAKGFASALALLGVCVFVGVAVFVGRGGDLSKVNPLDSMLEEPSQESESWRLLRLRDDARKRRFLQIERNGQ